MNTKRWLAYRAINIVCALRNVFNLINHFQNEQRPNDERNESTVNGLRVSSCGAGNDSQRNDGNMQSRHLVDANQKCQNQNQFDQMQLHEKPEYVEEPFGSIVEQHRFLERLQRNKWEIFKISSLHWV